MKTLIRLTALGAGLLVLFASNSYGDIVADSLTGNYLSEQPAKARHGVREPVREKAKKTKIEKKAKKEEAAKDEKNPAREKDERAELVFPKGKGPSQYLKSAKIWRSFAENFQLCKPKPNCYPVDIGTWGLRSSNSYTCHAQGLAIDVGGIACPGVKTVRSGSATGVFADFVKCMTKEKRVKGADGKMRTVVMKHKIYRDFKKLAQTGNRTLAHFDHVHLSNGCLSHGVRAY